MLQIHLCSSIIAVQSRPKSHLTVILAIFAPSQDHKPWKGLLFRRGDQIRIPPPLPQWKWKFQGGGGSGAKLKASKERYGVKIGPDHGLERPSSFGQEGWENRVELVRGKEKGISDNRVTSHCINQPNLKSIDQSIFI